MTRLSQKQRERLFIDQAIRSLGMDWTILGEREPPDFVIADGEHRFGLDVSDIFMGLQSDSGSAMKKDESDTQKILNALRHEYEAVTGSILLQVKFAGRITQETTANVISALIALDFASKPLAYQTIIDTNLGLRVYVTKAFRPEWYSVNHRVGWVERSPQKIIADAIEAKSAKLLQYQVAAGPDIRLLLVADAIHNSGKMRLPREQTFNFHGFEAVYFFPYPEEVILLDKAAVI